MTSWNWRRWAWIMGLLTFVVIAVALIWYSGIRMYTVDGDHGADRLRHGDVLITLDPSRALVEPGSVVTYSVETDDGGAVRARRVTEINDSSLVFAVDVNNPEVAAQLEKSRELVAIDGVTVMHLNGERKSSTVFVMVIGFAMIAAFWPTGSRSRKRRSVPPEPVRLSKGSA